MLRRFWDAALAVVPDAPDEARTLRFGREGELADLLDSAGFADVVETTLDVDYTYADFDELWSGFRRGIGPAGSSCESLPDEIRAAVRDELFRGLGSPTDAFTLAATALCAHARKPD